MSTDIYLLICYIDDRPFALPVESVQSVVAAVEVTPLPNGSSTLMGVINVRGRLVPVADLRRALGLPPRELQITDCLVLIESSGRLIALPIDRVDTVVPSTELADATCDPLPETRGVRGFVRTADKLALLYDLAVLMPRLGAADADQTESLVGATS